MNGFYEYILGIWHSSLPTQLARAICVALVFEALVYLITRALRGWLRPIIEQDAGAEPVMRVRRRRVVVGVPAVVVRVVLYVIAILMILRILGLDIRSELIPVGTGVLVLAAVMGRNALRDLLHGYLMICAYSMSIGEEVAIAGHRGIVESIALRSTRLRTGNDEIITVPNGAITDIVNYSRKLRASA